MDIDIIECIFNKGNDDIVNNCKLTWMKDKWLEKDEWRGPTIWRRYHVVGMKW